ncbi:MAG: hypothetical protein WA814_10710, partial [Candidatus Baltobacteraceae bacterium]
MQLSSTARVLTALARGERIAAEAYTLHGDVLHAIEAAARRGASVVIRLAGSPYEDPKGRLARENAALVRELRAAGADAALEPGLHAKAIEVDGTLYLDEKNWQSGDLVVSIADPAEAATIPAVKHEALAREAQALRDARRDDGPIVESESFGCCNAVCGARDALARAGARPRWLVAERDLRGNDRERRTLE